LLKTTFWNAEEPVEFTTPVLLNVALPKFVVAPFELKVPLFAKAVNPLNVVLPPALKVPAFAKFDRPLMLVVPLVVNVAPDRLLKVQRINEAGHFVRPDPPVQSKPIEPGHLPPHPASVSRACLNGRHSRVIPA
jgi:hypothetical protein